MAGKRLLTSNVNSIAVVQKGESPVESRKNRSETVKLMHTTKCATDCSVMFVLGLAHSGSTLLGRVLNMHSSLLCVGELMRIDDALEKQLPCSCGTLIPQCEFWSDYVPWIKKTNSFKYKDFTPDFYERLRQLTNSEVIVDLSKTRAFRVTNKTFPKRTWKSTDARFVLALRDPRGVAASALRRGDQLGKFLAKYEKWMKRYERLVKTKDEVLVVRYESLCDHPEREIKRMCRFIGVEFEADMLKLADKSHHFIHSSASTYLRNVNQLKIDERWKDELSDKDIIQVEEVIKRLDILRKEYV